MIDAVLSYHLDPAGCGVAKFNHALAKRLGVPCLPLMPWPVGPQAPLISVKASELTPADREWLTDMVAPESGVGMFSVFWHDAGIPYVTKRATNVYRGEEIGCPSTLDGNPTRGAYRVLTFGMLHKTLAPHFTQLKHRLDQEHPDYTIELSAAIHEGKPCNLDAVAADLRAIFGDKLRVLGFLGDDALAKELQEVDAVALYYAPALRANNTTAWAVLEAGKRLYTNTDEHSPPLDVSAYSWDQLLERLRA